MRKYLIPKDGVFYKANLHSHSNLSDGRLSPEEMKAEYKKRGYSVLAVSDHDFLHQHNELTEKDFLLLTAYEINIKDESTYVPYCLKKVVDLNLIAKDPKEKRHIGFHPQTVQWLVDKGVLSEAEVNGAEYAGELRNMEFSVENINKIIKSANENGYLVTLNHPMYSLVDFKEYSEFEGAWAMEVYNHSCKVTYGSNDSENMYEDMLRSGKSLFALATDDNHNHIDDSFGGFTFIKAKGLDYASVIEALEKGHFYASTGPEINELYIEDGMVHLKCSAAREVSMLTFGRKGFRCATEDGSPVESAVFPIEEDMKYVRFRVLDNKGNKAYTNAYYIY
ncbi:MAG: hypothetical protein E7412_06885 [Ruminococcaceae bacterium]|nr:hypothetical protein [Oscillospiraceae bacterium]